MPWQDSAMVEGQELYHDLAVQGHPPGMVALGICLAGGDAGSEEPSPQSEAEACQWWRKAGFGAQQHQPHPEALYQLAVATYTGAGVPVDEPAAAVLFAEAVLASIPSCAAAIEGRGDVVSKAVAASALARKNDRQGGNPRVEECHPAALYMLGDCLLEGIGVPSANKSDALGVLLHAGELGHRGARSRLLALLGQRSNRGSSPSRAREEEEVEGRFGKFTDASRQSLRLSTHLAPSSSSSSSTSLSASTLPPTSHKRLYASSSVALDIRRRHTQAVVRSPESSGKEVPGAHRSGGGASSSSGPGASGRVGELGRGRSVHAHAVAMDIRRRRTQAVLRPEVEAEEECEWFGEGGWVAALSDIDPK